MWLPRCPLARQCRATFVSCVVNAVLGCDCDGRTAKSSRCLSFPPRPRLLVSSPRLAKGSQPALPRHPGNYGLGYGIVGQYRIEAMLGLTRVPATRARTAAVRSYCPGRPARHAATPPRVGVDGSVKPNPERLPHIRWDPGWPLPPGGPQPVGTGARPKPHQRSAWRLRSDPGSDGPAAVSRNRAQGGHRGAVLRAPDIGALRRPDRRGASGRGHEIHPWSERPGVASRRGTSPRPL